MLSSAALTNELAAFFVPLGIAGAAFAVLCSVVAMVALARDAVGIAGGATGVWIVGALLASAAGFANDWMPLAVAALALVTALVLGSVARTVFSRPRVA